jgi:sortase A
VRRFERWLWGVGLALLGVYLLARGHGAFMKRRAVEAYAAQRAAPSPDAPSAAELPADAVDTHLWSPQRIREYEQSLAGNAPPTLAVLRIPRIHLEVPVLDGTDDLTLNRGVGRIAGTARPGTMGNLGIAGHRDGFFRALKDIEIGDEITLVTRGSTETCRVASTSVVDPGDVSVLDPTIDATVTLVTCYPFYFVGAAPQRYIVHARCAATGAR